MAKKTNLLQDTQRKLEVVNDDEYTLEHQVPAIVQAWGLAVGASAVSQQPELKQMYGGVALRVARLLETLGVTEVSEEAVESVSKRWATNVNAWVAVGNRVTALHDAWRYEQHEDISRIAERLWAALEARSQAITGSKFEDVLK